MFQKPIQCIDLVFWFILSFTHAGHDNKIFYKIYP